MSLEISLIVVPFLLQSMKGSYLYVEYHALYVLQTLQILLKCCFDLHQTSNDLWPFETGENG